jgi:hypothetical protein
MARDDASILPLCVLRLSAYESAVVLSVLVEAADELIAEMPMLIGDAAREAARFRVALESVISRLVELR